MLSHPLLLRIEWQMLVSGRQGKRELDEERVLEERGKGDKEGREEGGRREQR